MGTTRPIRLLVICTANTCRSPMAAALLTAELATSGVGALVASAGTEGPAGRAASATSVEVMEEVGIDITAHRSRVVDIAAIEHADLVLVMTRAHERAMAATSGQAAGRVFLLGEFALLVDAAESASGAEGSGLDRLLRMIASRPPTRPSQLGMASADEIDDPYGGSIDRYRLTRDRLAVEAGRIVAAIAPP